MKQFSVLFKIILSGWLVTACNSKTESSPYDSIYSLPAIKEISDSIQRFPDNDQLYYRRFKALISLDDKYLDAALYDLNSAWKLKRTLPYAWEFGTTLVLKNKDSAISFLKNALLLYPNSVELKETLGNAYETAGDFDNALKTFDATIAMEPDNPWYKRKKAGVLDKMGKKAEAIEILKDLFDKGEKFVGEELAFMLAQSKDPKTLALCDEMIKTDSAHERAEPHYFKGVYFYNIDNKAKAIEEFDKAIRINFNFLDAYLEKGRTLYESKKINEALKVFTLASAVSPAFADSYYWIGKCQQALGQDDEAKLNYQRAYGFDKTLTEAKDSADKIK